jgi:hypothetical protein
MALAWHWRGDGQLAPRAVTQLTRRLDVADELRRRRRCAPASLHLVAATRDESPWSSAFEW